MLEGWEEDAGLAAIGETPQEATALGPGARQGTQERTWPGGWGASGVGTDAPREEGEHREMDDVPLIFLGVIRLTEVTEHHAYSVFSFLYHTTQRKSYI